MEDRYNVECCDFIHAHEDVVEKVFTDHNFIRLESAEADCAVYRLDIRPESRNLRRELPGEDTLYDLTELFRIFGDSTRVRILYVLFESEMCVCDVVKPGVIGVHGHFLGHEADGGVVHPVNFFDGLFHFRGAVGAVQVGELETFESEMCVCDIAALLGLTQSAVSHQLRALKNVRLVKSRREGKSPAPPFCIRPQFPS